MTINNSEPGSEGKERLKYNELYQNGPTRTANNLSSKYVPVHGTSSTSKCNVLIQRINAVYLHAVCTVDRISVYKTAYTAYALARGISETT